jgi:hypothetical protein
MALAGGAIFVVPNQSPSAMTTGCGQLPCAAPVEPPAITIQGPLTSPSATPPGVSRPAKPHVTHSPRAASGTSPAGAASATPPAASQPSPSVTVTYTLVAQWGGGMLGEFTVTNIGSTSIAGWELSAAFPGDQIQPVSGTSAPDGGDVLVMEATPDSPAIAPGASQSGDFIAQGDTIAPSDCTVNGVTCPGYSTQDNPDGNP